MYKRVWQSIRENNLSPVYLFFGTERHLLEETVAKLIDLFAPDEGANAMNIEKLDGGSISPADVVNAASLSPFFAQRKLVLVEKAPWFLGKHKDKKEEVENEDDGDDLEESLLGLSDEEKVDMSSLLEYLQNPLKSTCLVFVAQEKAHKNLALVKAIKKAGHLVEFTSLKGQELFNWGAKAFENEGKKASREAINQLIFLSGDNLSLLGQEIQKVIAFTGDAVKIEASDVTKVSSGNKESDVFALCDSLSLGDAAESLALCAQLLRQKHNEYMLLATIAGHFRLAMQVKSLSDKGLRPAEIAVKLQKHPYPVEKAVRMGRRYSYFQLKEILALILQADVAIKRGFLPPKESLELAVLKICAVIKGK